MFEKEADGTLFHDVINHYLKNNLQCIITVGESSEQLGYKHCTQLWTPWGKTKNIEFNPH